VAVIVGCSSGMGKATALLFAKEGAAVALAARNEKALSDLAKIIQKDGGRAIYQPTDVQNKIEVENLIKRTLNEFKRIDILIYSAGTNIPERSLQVLTDQTWQMMLATNLSGAFYCTKAVLPIMREQKDGLIIYVSSGAVQRPDVSGVSYQASKHGLVGLAHGTMQEEKASGIRTSVIFPGLTDTPILLKRPVPTPPEIVAKALQPEDVASACLFVASLPKRAHVPELILMPSGI
jgi:NADP-dependent 3-hydroxy acid dehydrogenase YdfG